MIRKISSRGLDLVKEREGLFLKPYLCPAGVPTIGYGSTVYADGRMVTLKDKPITKEVAESLLLDTMVQYEKGVNDAVKVEISQGQFDALVDFAYNLGIGALKNSTLMKKLNAGDYSGACEQFSRWVYAGGKIQPGLVIRCKKRQELFNS